VHTVYLSLGSNLGDRRRNLDEALRLLRERGVAVSRVSRVYETEPQDVRDQPWFLNVAAEAQTRLFPVQLLHETQRVERQLGRKRAVAKGPRTIDIDILLFDGAVVETEELQIPHPRMASRRFVLEPLAELAPELRHPVTRESVAKMLEGVRGQGLRAPGATRETR